MLFYLSGARRRRLAWPRRLGAVILGIMPACVGGTLKAQTTNPPEVSTQVVEPTYTLKTERNLVMVRAVVRDASGKPVESLHKEDFEILDHGKRQDIVSFSLENPALKDATTAPPKPAEKAGAGPEARSLSSMATRFVALLFDDVNTPFEGLKRTRDAADHYLSSSIQPEDRVALFTSSGQHQIDFTSNLAQIRQALGELQPRPVAPKGPMQEYIAHRIVELNDPDALAVVTGCPPPLQSSQACAGVVAKARADAQVSLSFSNTQSTAVLREVESIVRQMTSLPGQRSIVIVSGGFQTFSVSFRFDLDRITDLALRAGVTINALDARGLYGDPLTSDMTTSLPTDPDAATMIGALLREGVRLEAAAMRNLAHDTGGAFFENSNDLDTGFRKVAGTPEAYYLLAFSPQNMKHDGAYHTIQVKVAGLKGLTVQARPGYFDPKKTEDAASQAKEDIREALYSQDQTQGVPVQVHTQFFKESDSKTNITVFTHVDLRPLHFVKQGDRNFDKLTFVTAIFDQDGHVVSIQQKVLDFQMHDATLEKFLQTGVTIRNEFDVGLGTYAVREVVRDSQSGQISSVNSAVEIGY